MIDVITHADMADGPNKNWLRAGPESDITLNECAAVPGLEPRTGTLA
jgi:hypothetical protein